MSVELAEAALLNETQSYESKPEEQTACCSGDKSACGGDKSACACCSVGNDADDEAPVEEVAETELETEELETEELETEYVPEAPKLDMITAFREELLSHVEKAQANHLEYFIAGLLLATHFPAVAWLFLAGVSSIPTVIVLLHPEWLMANPQENWMHQSLIIGVCVTSEICAFRYLGNIFPGSPALISQ
jgi:hypothetical protein